MDCSAEPINRAKISVLEIDLVTDTAVNKISVDAYEYQASKTNNLAPLDNEIFAREAMLELMQRLLF